MSSALDLLTDACVGLPVRVQKMFGGHGFFAPNGGMFAGIVTDDAIMLKLEDPIAKAELIGLGGHAWVYQGRDKPMTMASWIIVPESFYDDQELFSGWAKRAHALVPPKKLSAKRPTKSAEPKKPAEPKKSPKKAATPKKRVPPKSGERAVSPSKQRAKARRR